MNPFNKKKKKTVIMNKRWVMGECGPQSLSKMLRETGIFFLYK